MTDLLLEYYGLWFWGGFIGRGEPSPQTQVFSGNSNYGPLFGSVSLGLLYMDRKKDSIRKHDSH